MELRLSKTTDQYNTAEDHRLTRDTEKFNLVVPDFKSIFENTSGFGVTVSMLMLISLVMWYLHVEKVRRLKDFPPGPRSNFGLLKCFFRYLISGKVDHLLGVQWYEKDFGKIIGVHTTFFRAVFICSLPELKEAFKTLAVSSRPPSRHIMLYPDDNPRGLISATGEAWKEMRKFTVGRLRDYGMGQHSLEPIIMEQADEIVSVMRTKVGRPFSTRHFFNLPACNIPWQIISSRRFKIGDPVGQNLVHHIEVAAMDWLAYFIVEKFPRMATWSRIFWRRLPYVTTNKAFREFAEEFVYGRVAEIQNDKSVHHNDLAQDFIIQAQSTTDVKSQFYGQLGYENLVVTIRDLFFAATETTGTSMSWMVLYLALHPEKQEKLQKEIGQVLGGQRPFLDARLRMPYAQAVISEALRMSSNAPMLIPHMTTEEVKIGKYTVPKGTEVYGNIYGIHHSTDIWGDPYVFRPERFLSDDESIFTKHEALLSFGTGKRACPGETLALQEMFLFLTSIFQEFSITWNPEEPKPTMDTTFGLGLVPQDHTLIISLRNQNKEHAL